MRLFQVIIFCATATLLGAGPLDHWHSRTNFGYSALNDIAYHDGVYVLLNTTPGAIITATNLVTPGKFAVHTLSEGRPRAVEYGGGRFVVVSEGGPIVSSTNGYDWVTHGASGPYWGLEYANGRFVAVGSRSVATSTNGTDWVTSSDVSTFVSDVVYGNGIFLATGSTTNSISRDGIVWEHSVLPSRASFYTVGFGEGKFVGITIGGFGPNIFTSTDGRNWTEHGRLELLRPGSIAVANGYFVTAGGSGRAYSDDGISWTVLQSNQTAYRVEFVNGRFAATGWQTLAESDPVVQVLLENGELRVHSVPGKGVRVEAADSLTEDWQDLGSTQANLSGEVFVKLPSGSGQRFFRAVLAEGD